MSSVSSVAVSSMLSASSSMVSLDRGVSTAVMSPATTRFDSPRLQILSGRMSSLSDMTVHTVLVGEKLWRIVEEKVVKVWSGLGCFHSAVMLTGKLSCTRSYLIN